MVNVMSHSENYEFKQHIVTTPDVRSGKPCIINRRITVSDVVIWHFKMGYSLDEIGVKWSLPLAAVHAAISFYYDNQAKIEAQIEASDAKFEELKTHNPSLLETKLNSRK